MLINLRGHDHFRRAFPRVDFFQIVVQAHEPVIRTGTQRKHRERVTKFMLARRELDAIGRPTPDELSIESEECDAVVTAPDRFVHLDGEPDRGCREARKSMRFLAARLDNFPTKELTLRATSPI